jgi:hypothetical protein
VHLSALCSIYHAFASSYRFQISSSPPFHLYNKIKINILYIENLFVHFVHPRIYRIGINIQSFQFFSKLLGLLLQIFRLTVIFHFNCFDYWHPILFQLDLTLQDRSL